MIVIFFVLSSPNNAVFWTEYEKSVDNMLILLVLLRKQGLLIFPGLVSMQKLEGCIVRATDANWPMEYCIFYNSALKI